MEDSQREKHASALGRPGWVSEDAKIEMLALRHAHCFPVTSFHTAFVRGLFRSVSTASRHGKESFVTRSDKVYWILQTRPWNNKYNYDIGLLIRA
jgi:hypothetical protein